MGLARMLKALWDIPALTVALVQGGAWGGGCGLAAACDIAVAERGAKFGFSETRLGLVAATISPYVIAAIGPRAARGLFASARTFDADEALRLGLVSELVDDAPALAAAADRIAGEAMACAPGAIAASKALVDAVAWRDIDHALMEDTARRIAKARVSEEGREGVAAFLARRAPSWAGQG
jgi:methylglutaconyl-CoA hydratase